MNKYYFTFMISQYALNDYYVIIEAEDSGTAREIMIKHFGDKWAFMYYKICTKHYPKGVLLTIKQQQ